MKFKMINESIEYYPGTFVDETTFLDSNGNPYELKISKLPSTQSNSTSNSGGSSDTGGGNNSNNDSENDNSDNNSDSNNNSDSDNNSETNNKPRIRINNKTGKREIYIPQMKIWRSL